MNPNEVRILLKETFREWWNDGASRLAAALAFYTVFSFAPMLIIVIAVASIVFGEEAARGEVVSQFQSLLGERGARVVETILRHSRQQSRAATALGLGTLLFGATIVFAELQEALNTIWGVTVKPGRSLRVFLKKRVVSFAMVLAIGFLLLVSLLISAALSAAAKFLAGSLPVPSYMLQTAQFIFSFCVITLLFAIIYKVLPDARIMWSDVWIGAAATSLLFTVGKTLIGIYLGNTSVGSAYGAAGSFVIFLVWVYYSAQIFFLGAEFTEVYAKRHGSQIVPAENAVRVVKVVRGKL